MKTSRLTTFNPKDGLSKPTKTNKTKENGTSNRQTY